ncbi:MAG: insulinase family protein [Spirochaetes bacterium]|nr:insulinase family protein [Spirochaetota bacterium]
MKTKLIKLSIPKISFKTFIVFIIFSLLFLFLAADTNEYYTYTKLSNGLELYLVKRTKIPLVAFYLAFKTGAYRETPEYDGLTHLFEHMFFKANKTMKTAVDYYEFMNRTGITYNGWTSQEEVVYYFICPKDNIRDAADLMYNSIVNTALDEEELKKEREVVLEEYARVYSSRVNYLFQYLMFKELYKDNLSRKSVIGNYDMIKTATVDKMKKLKETFFIPNNGALIIVGDIDIDKTISMIDEIFSKWNRGPEIKEENFILNPLPEDRFVFNHRFDKENIDIYMLGVGPSLRGEGNRDITNFAGDIYHYALSLKNSKFTRALSSYTDSFNFYLQWNAYYGDIEFYTKSVKGENIIDFYKTFRRELDKSADPGYITEEEFDKAKKYYVDSSSKKINWDNYTLEGIANILSKYWAKNWLDLILFQKEKEYYEKVKYQDVLEYAKRYIVKKGFVWGILIDEKLAEQYNLKSLNK